MKSDLAGYYSRITENEFFLAGRILTLIWLVKVLVFNVDAASQYPTSLITPTGFVTLPGQFWLEIFFSFPVLTGFKILTVASLVLFLVWINRTGFGLLSLILLYLFSNISHSFGSYIYHADIVLFLCQTIFVLSLIVKKFLRADNNDESHIALFFCLSAIALVLSYSMIAVHRLIFGGFDLMMSDYMLYTIIERSAERIDFTYALGLTLADYTWFNPVIKMGFITATLMEMLSPAIFISKSFRYLWLIIIIAFHVSTLFLMNIFFWENVLLVVILFTGVLKTIGGYKPIFFERIAPL